MPEIIRCPNCDHRQNSEPEECTYTATATARITATLDGNGQLLDYTNPEVDPEEGYRDIRCEYCGESLGDLTADDLRQAEGGSYNGGPPEEDDTVSIRVRADVNMELGPRRVGKDAAAHTALVQVAEKRGIALTTAADPSGAYVEGHAAGTLEQMLPMLEELGRGGHCYDADIDTDDETIMDRVLQNSAAIAYLKFDDHIEPPSLR